MRRSSTVLSVTMLLMVTAAPAWACGFLVAENGAVRLVRSAALAAWEDGVEHYVTSFEFQGGGAAFGSIVPLPGEPTTVEKAGGWTLQRLARETQPQPQEDGVALRAAGATEAEVLREVAIDALDVTIIKGAGDAVLAWANENGFDLGDDAGEMLSFYADRSPYFMAARFDVDRAQDFSQTVGDGTPVHLAIPTEDPWVPLRILGYAKPGTEIVEADVYLLTPDEPSLLPAGRDGLTVEVSRPAGDLLLDDLRSDENSSWVPEEAWLTYVRVSVPAGRLDYDLAVDVDGARPSAEAAFGRGSAAATIDGLTSPAGFDGDLVAIVALVVGGIVIATAFATSGRRSERM